MLRNSVENLINVLSIHNIGGSYINSTMINMLLTK